MSNRYPELNNDVLTLNIFCFTILSQGQLAQEGKIIVHFVIIKIINKIHAYVDILQLLALTPSKLFTCIRPMHGLYVLASSILTIILYIKYKEI